VFFNTVLRCCDLSLRFCFATLLGVIATWAHSGYFLAFFRLVWHGASVSVIEVRGLRKSYGENLAVAGIDLSIAQGEIFALLGPNGAGKTTTVEILEGFRDRDSGEISVLGHDPQQSDKSGRIWRNRIGIVLQATSDAGDLRVSECIEHFAKYYSNPRDPESVIAAVGLSEKRDDLIRNLSGGQRRRLDVALGIIGNPELLFLDEPTTGFDPEARRAFWELIRSLQSDGTTILLTTHYLDEAEALADRVAVINHGKILEIATPQKLGGRSTSLTKVQWLENGEIRSEESSEPTAVVKRLASQFPGEIPGLTISRPTLEDVYLTMIGGAE